MASFDSIDYSVRPNKNVERKLFFEMLRSLEGYFPISKYSYIGMGSMWFVDFVLAHKWLGIGTLVSIEKEKHAKRANFNRPYKCIEVVSGDSNKLLPTLDYNRPCIAWLDYDTGPEGPGFSDAEYMVQHVQPGSIVAVTLNAHIGRLDVKDPESDEQLSRRDALRFFVGDDNVSADVPKNFGPAVYIELLGQILREHFERSIRRSGRDCRIIPLASFKYSDNAPMVTICGMVADRAAEAKLEEAALSRRFEFAYGSDLYEIKVPLLTPREKFALDAHLPAATSLSPANVGVPISEGSLANYQKHYLYYPIFGEMILV